MFDEEDIFFESAKAREAYFANVGTPDARKKVNKDIGEKLQLNYKNDYSKIQPKALTILRRADKSKFASKKFTR